MNSERTCTVCRQPLDDFSPQGLCAACLMRAGLGTDVAVETRTRARTGPAGFVAPPLEEIARLFPQLEVIAFLGQGGMGAVYQARQPALERRVALKVLPVRASAQPGFTERFNREARALARLSHPGIVAVYDFGQVEGLPYLLMEYVDGATLRQVIQARHLAPREALDIVPQICAALQFAHDEGVVHRDIKPENILLDRKGRVKIADFGIAKIIDPEAPPAMLTGARDVVGTPHYMAPEQVEHPREVDHRADIFSLGVVFYEMLTGELPLGKFPPPSHKAPLDTRLDEVVMRTLEKEPENRYQRAGEVRTAVETISRAEAPTGAGPVSADAVGVQAQGRPSRRPRRGWLLGVLILCGILFSLATILPGPWSAFLLPATIAGAGFALLALGRDHFLRRFPSLSQPRRRAVAAVAALGVAGFAGAATLLLSPEGAGLPSAPATAARMPFRPRRAEAPPYSAQLQVGRIELVAVRRVGATNESWWSPDGSPSEYGALIRPIGPAQSGPLGSATNRDDVLFLLRSDHEVGVHWKQAHFTDLMLDPTLANGETTWEGLADRGHFSVWVERIPESAPTATLSLTLATGPWTILSTQIPGVWGWFKSSPGRRYWSWTQGFGSVDVTLEHLHWDPDWITELVLWDAGQRLRTPRTSMTTTRSGEFYGTSITAQFIGLEEWPPRQFQLRTRPYETVEFRNISLVPGRRTQLEILDRAPAEESAPLASAPPSNR